MSPLINSVKVKSEWMELAFWRNSLVSNSVLNLPKMSYRKIWLDYWNGETSAADGKHQ